MSRVQKLWRGELSLANAFWGWAVLGGLIVNASTSAAFLALIMASRPLAAFLAGYALSVPYNIIVTVGVWRSSARYNGERRWAELARILTVVEMLVLSVT